MLLFWFEFCDFCDVSPRPGGHMLIFGVPTVEGGEGIQPCEFLTIRIPSVNWQTAFQLSPRTLRRNVFNILSFITDQKLSFVFLAAHLGPVFLREYAHISYTKTADWKSSLFCTLSQGFVTRGSTPSLPWELRLGRRLLVDKPTNIYARKKNVILH